MPTNTSTTVKPAVNLLTSPAVKPATPADTKAANAAKLAAAVKAKQTPPRKITTGKAGKPAKHNVEKPILGAAAAAQAAAGRSNVAPPVKPATTTTGKPATDNKPATDAAPTPARNLARDAAGIVRAATNFESISERDNAYLRFFGHVMRPRNNSCTLVDLHNAGKPDPNKPKKHRNPFYAGSSKATDVGAINRAIAAGHIRRNADGHTLSATAIGLTNAFYLGTNKS